MCPYIICAMSEDQCSNWEEWMYLKSGAERSCEGLQITISRGGERRRVWGMGDRRISNWEFLFLFHFLHYSFFFLFHLLLLLTLIGTIWICLCSKNVVLLPKISGMLMVLLYTLFIHKKRTLPIFSLSISYYLRPPNIDTLWSDTDFKKCNRKWIEKVDGMWVILLKY